MVSKVTIKPLDVLIILGLLSAAIASFFLGTESSPGNRLVVENRGETILSAPLSEDRDFTLQGPLGKSLLSVKGGKVHMISSPCPRKACMGMGGISQAGEMIACVPNGLIIRIEGKERGKKDYDLLSH